MPLGRRPVPDGRPLVSRLVVNPVLCRGHGLCAELLPEIVRLDEWGYPVLADPDVPRALRGEARSAVAACPTLAIRLARGE